MVRFDQSGTAIVVIANPTVKVAHTRALSFSGFFQAFLTVGAPAVRIAARNATCVTAALVTAQIAIPMAASTRHLVSKRDHARSP